MATVAAFDALAWLVLPECWLPTTLPFYQCPRGEAAARYRPDAELGFDFKANWYHFTNAVACRSPTDLEAFRDGAPYAYFAGDSVTHGLDFVSAPYPTVYRGRTGRLTLNCGVVGTGQHHQFLKFLRVAKALGHYPERVFVGYYYANDWRDNRDFPHELDHIPLSPRLRTYLLSYALLHRLRSLSLKAEYRRVYAHGARLLPRFPTHPEMARSRQAIRAWASHAREEGYALVFLLLPNRDMLDQPHIYRAMRGWLDEEGVEYLDLAARTSGLGRDVWSSLYKPFDATHPRDAGHRFFGEVVAEHYP